MGASKSGSSGTQHYLGTIACLIGDGPLFGLKSILLNGAVAWSGPIYRAATTNPVELTTTYGVIRLYWGTEDQPADALLNTYEDHPPYRGLAYVVFCDFDHGSAPNAYNVEFIAIAAPEQSIVAGAPAATTALAATGAVNPIVAAAEILTAPQWLGLDPTALAADTFQAVADSLHAEGVHALAPFYDQPTETRRALAELAAQGNCWLRVDSASRISCGRWTPADALAVVTSLTWDDLTDRPEIERPDTEEIPNSYAVEFVDRDALHKEAKFIVDDNAALAVQPLRRQTLSAPFLTTYDQAHRAGLVALARATATTWKGDIRTAKAITPAGAPLCPGDLVRVPISPAAAPLATCLLRITKVVRPRDATAATQIEGELVDANQFSGANLVVDPYEPPPFEPSVMPPVPLLRLFSLPADPLTVSALVARPLATATHAAISYDDTAVGDFPVLGITGYALPLALALDLTTSAASARVSLLPPDAHGAALDLDQHLLRDWSGGATEGRDDQLLLIVLEKSGDGISHTTSPAGCTLENLEVLSVAGAPELVASDTWDVSVLRGRRGTLARGFATTTAEVWLVPRAQLSTFVHADWLGLLTEAKTGYFRAAGWSPLISYAPALAYAERQRRQAAASDEGPFASQPDATTFVRQTAYTLPVNSCWIPPEEEDPEPGDYADLVAEGGFATGGSWSPAGGLQYRGADTTYTVHGFAGYAVGEDGKWRSYKRATLSGNGIGRFFNKDHTPTIWDEAFSCAGSILISIANDGELSKTGALVRTSAGAHGKTTDYFSDHATPESVGFGVAYHYAPPFTFEYTPNQVSTISDQVTWQWYDSYHFFGDLPLGGPVYTDLDQEDTDHDAIARAQSQASWGEWDSLTCTARRATRRASWSAAVSLAQYKGGWAGAVPHWTYTLTVPTLQRALGAPEWTTGPTMTHTLVADADGVLTLPATDLDTAEGTERIVDATNVELLP